MGLDPDCAIAALGGIECRFLAFIYCCSDFDCLVLPLAIDGSLVGEKAYCHSPVGSATGYGGATAAFYGPSVMVGAAGKFGCCALGVSGDCAHCANRLSSFADLN